MRVAVGQRQIAQAETTALLEAWLRRLHEDGGAFAACIDGSAVAQLARAVSVPVTDLDMALPPEDTYARAGVNAKPRAVFVLPAPHASVPACQRARSDVL